MSNKDEYAFVVNRKVGGDMLTVRSDDKDLCLKLMLEFESYYKQTFGEPERTVVTHLDDEPSALENCQQPGSHGMKYAKPGKRGAMYCFECFRVVQQAKGLWKGK